MASDYGDEAGSKMIDDFMRFGERMGERAMYARAGQMQRAFQNATRDARAAAGEEAPTEGRSEWAKLDMHEFQGIEDYEAIKGIIEDRLASHGVGSTWFPDPETGKEYLLFRIADAVDDAGNPADLEYIDFVKVQTAQMAVHGRIGEASTEVFAIGDYTLLRRK